MYGEPCRMNGSTESATGRCRTTKWIFAAILAAGAFLRLAALEIRPLHGDEAIGASIFREVARSGSFVYEFANRHGPFQYFLGGAVMAIGGESSFWIRLPYALAGCFLPLTLLPFRSRLREPGLILAAGLLAFSPSFVYYSRYAIQEIDFLTATALFLGCGVAFASGRSGFSLVGLFLAGAWMVTVKETFIVVWGCVVAALALGAVAGGERFRSALRAGFRNAARRPLSFLVGALLGLLFVVGAYSDFFKNTAGLGNLAWNLREMLSLGASSVGAATLHNHPASFYLFLLLFYEWPILVLFLAGACSAFRFRRPFALFLTFYALLTAGVSLALPPYKTPWLLLTPLLPMAILSGYGGVTLIEIPAWVKRPWVPILIGTIFILLSLPWTLLLNFERPADPITEPIVYHQTGEEQMALVSDIRRFLSGIPCGSIPRAFISLPYLWPLAWYLRDEAGVLYQCSAIPSGHPSSFAPIPILVTMESGDRKFLKAFTGSDTVSPFSLPNHVSRRYVLIPPDYAVARLWIRSDLAKAGFGK